jgi:hypothetical protein
LLGIGLEDAKKHPDENEYPHGRKDFFNAGLSVITIDCHKELIPSSTII